jgi:hypothetical protein
VNFEAKLRVYSGKGFPFNRNLDDFLIGFSWFKCLLISFFDKRLKAAESRLARVISLTEGTALERRADSILLMFGPADDAFAENRLTISTW